MNFIKSTAKIGTIFADVFVSNETNDYFYSLTSIAGLIAKPDNSALRFLGSKAFKAIQGEDFQPYIFTEGNKTYKLIPCNIALEYLIIVCVKKCYKTVFRNLSVL